MRVRSIRTQESGLVSIIITMILMIVLSLIVLGFAQLARNNQRETLDRQLSTQALYAAESGVNMAVKAINNGFDTNITDCDPTNILPGENYDLGNNAEISCLLIDQTPPVLNFDAVTVDKSTVFPIKSVNPNTGDPLNLDSLTIKWRKKDGGSSYPSTDAPNLPPAPSWSGTAAGMLRIDLVPTASSDLTRTKLAQNSFTVFAYPKGSDGNITYTASKTDASQGAVKEGNCTNYECTLKITMPASLSRAQFYMRLKSIYVDNEVEIVGRSRDLSVDGGTAHFTGAQAKIDVTGKAADVLKRIQVGRPIDSYDTTFADQALDVAQPICKLLKVQPKAGGSLDGCNIPDQTPQPQSCPIGQNCDQVNNGDPNGNAAIGTYCLVRDCSVETGFQYSSATDSRRWIITIVNNSANDNSVVRGCDWNYGDGKTDKNVHCNKGDQFQHQFPTGGGCKSYTTKLVMHFNNGAPDKTTYKTYWVPDNNKLPSGADQFDGPC